LRLPRIQTAAPSAAETTAKVTRYDMLGTL
jgi:hypothetical protein